MAVLLDTDVVIHLRDGDLWVIDQVDTLDPPLLISGITRVELENGVWRDAEEAVVRRSALDFILTQVTALDFGAPEVGAYRAILTAAGFSRRKIADRMTAATALAGDFALVTLNGKDFRDVPGLKLIEWSRPDE